MGSFSRPTKYTYIYIYIHTIITTTILTLTIIIIIITTPCTWEFHPLEFRIRLSRTLGNPRSSVRELSVAHRDITSTSTTTAASTSTSTRTATSNSNKHIHNNMCRVPLSGAPSS